MQKKHADPITEAAIGCLLGTAVGDALGLPAEGLSRRRQHRWFPALDGYHFLFGKGLCSDDTEHSCLLAQSLIVSGGHTSLFARDFAWRLRGWLLGLPAGIGWATLRAILKLWLFLPATFQGIYSAGNGPAMRCALLGVCFADDENKMQHLIRISTRMTHTDPKAECGALAIALATRCAFRQQTFNDFMADLKCLTHDYPKASDELLNLMQRIAESRKNGESTEYFVDTLGCQTGVTGYMYHSVPAVIHAWQSHPDDFAQALQSVIRCGGDTDTTAAMLGAIIGARVGKAGIPEPWLKNLIEWPRSVSWMETVAKTAVAATRSGHPSKAQPLSLLPLVGSNSVFFLLVLLHGFRRLLPPY